LANTIYPERFELESVRTHIKVALQQYNLHINNIIDN